MSTTDRRQRERVERERAIVRAARDLAEAEGWPAVTTRRLAALIDYSQPVLYSHFAGKDAIMTAAAVEGFAELAEALRAACAAASNPQSRTAAVAAAYVAFAQRRPALYDAMFSLTTALTFADETTPPALHEAFGALLDTLAPVARGDDPGTVTEVFWSALHGLCALTRSARLRPDHQEQRLAALVARFS